MVFVVWAKKNHCVGKSGAFRLVLHKRRERGKLDFAEAKSVLPESPTPLHNGWNVLRILALHKINKKHDLCPSMWVACEPCCWPTQCLLPTPKTIDRGMLSVCGVGKKKLLCGQKWGFQACTTQTQGKGKGGFAETKSVLRNPPPLHNGWNVLKIFALT